MATETYKLTAPDGTKVEVSGAQRRDALLARGYKETSSSSTKTTSKKTTKKF
jgi:hypothetical protein